MRTRFPRPRVLGVMGIITGLSLAGVSVGLATTATGSQNLDLTVSVSLASRGTADPEFATVGDTVDGALSVRNNKGWTLRPRLDEVKVRLTLETPSATPFSASATISLWSGQTLRVPFDYTVIELFPKGQYSVTLEAFEVSDPTMPPSSATATLTIY